MRAKILAVAVLCVAGPLHAQELNPSTPLINGSPGFTASNPGNITGSFSATLSGFTPGMTFATLTATATSGSVALPAGTVVAFQNTGSATVSCTLGVGSATALANEIQVPASSTVFVTVGSNTFGACIDQTGSTSNLVVLAGGSGLGTGFGGGGGGGGSGGNVTIVGPLGQALAAASVPVILPAATITTLTPPSNTGYSTAANQATEITSLGTIATNSGTQATAANQATGNASLATIATNSALPLPAQSTHAVDIGAVDILHTQDASAPINVSTATTTQIVPLSGSTSIYVTSFDVIAGGTGSITFEYGTGTACATGTTVLTGAYPLTAQAGIAKGAGIGTVLKVPSGNALCVLTSAAVQMSGSVSFQQF